MSDETIQEPEDQPVDDAAKPSDQSTTDQAAVEEIFAAEGQTAAKETATNQDSTISMKSELADAQRRVLLAQADLDNFRKRARRDAEESVKYAAMPLIRDLLPCLDNLQRAIEAQEQSESGEAGTGMLEGVKMVSQQLFDTLAQHHCKVIDATGEFDPNIHEALLQQPSQDHPAGTVIQATQPGYQLHDRVVRPTQVIVSKGPE